MVIERECFSRGEEREEEEEEKKQVTVPCTRMEVGSTSVITGG